MRSGFLNPARFGIAGACAAMAWAMAAPADAGLTCNTIGAVCYCDVSAVDTAFGSYDPFATSDATTTGRIDVTCGALLAVGMNYTVTLSAGNGGSYGARRMSAGAGKTLNYQLYTDAAHGSIFGNGAGGTSSVTNTVTLSVGFLAETDHVPVYGVAAKNQNAQVGSYTDPITVSVAF